MAFLKRKRKKKKSEAQAPPPPPPSQSQSRFPSVLNDLSIMASENIEVMTSESKSVLRSQRAAMRRKLFEDNHQIATNASHEVLANGRIQNYTPQKLTPERVSLPLSAVTSVSWDTEDVSSTGSGLRKLDEHSVDYPSVKNEPSYSSHSSSSSSSHHATDSRQNDDGILDVTPSLDDSRETDESSRRRGLDISNSSRPMDERGMDQEQYVSPQKAPDDEQGLNRELFASQDEDDDEQRADASEEQPSYDRSEGTPSTMETFESAQRTRKVAAMAAGGVAATLVTAAMVCGDQAIHNCGPSPTNDSSQLQRTMPESDLRKFLRRMFNNGFVLLYMQPTEDGEWNGRTVTLNIQKGGTDEGLRLPKLEWVTVAGGNSTSATRSSISLLDIHSIEYEDNEDELCMLSVTSEFGDIHIFEASSKQERDRIALGLNTIVSRWCSHIVAGDITATSELFVNESVFAYDMPELPNPRRTMDRVANLVLQDKLL